MLLLVLKWAGAITIVLYVLYAGLMTALHPKFIYPFDATPFEAAGIQRHDLAPDGPALYVAAAGADAPLVYYFMGNVGALGSFQAMLEHHRAMGRSVIAMGYRGGGGLPGEASEAALKADALAAFDAGIGLLPHPPSAVILHGYSLGTGLALHVAARRQADAVLLAAPYQRLCRLMAQASYLPACWMPGIQKWLSDQDAMHVDIPVAVLHGSADSLIPISEGERLWKALKKGRAGGEFIKIEGAAHNNLMGFPAYLDGIDGFIARVLRRNP